MPTKTEGLIIAGAGVGVAVPLIVREYYDTQKAGTPQAGEFVFDWKRPSALVGLAGGGVLLVLGLFGHRFARGLGTVAPLMVAAGPAMIAAGAYSAMYPKYPTTTARAAARASISPVRMTAGQTAPSGDGSGLTLRA